MSICLRFSDSTNKLDTMRLVKQRNKQFKVLNTVELSSENLLHNVKLFSELSNKKVIPVLKGNAYGHGITEISHILDKSSVDMVAVDSVFEANQVVKSSSLRVLVMGYVLPENLRLLDYKRVSYVIQDIGSLVELSKLNKEIRIHIELNTGMNRLGTSSKQELDDMLRIIEQSSKLKLEGVMSHLADADNSVNDFTDTQTAKFDEILDHIIERGFKPSIVHLAQTAGCLKTDSRHTNSVRVGIGCYGINPLFADDSHYKDLQELKPVLSLKSKIIKIMDLAAGEKISYNGTHETEKATIVATIPVGYYEGVPRELSNVGSVTVDDKELPILGRVCMNHTMIDITDKNLSVGDEVTVISNNPKSPNSIVKLKEEYGLFPYETLIHISSTIRRKIV